jgi:hypothetical protein
MPQALSLPPGAGRILSKILLQLSAGIIVGAIVAIVLVFVTNTAVRPMLLDVAHASITGPATDLVTAKGKATIAQVTSPLCFMKCIAASKACC